jgi:hypothetical protein
MMCEQLRRRVRFTRARTRRRICLEGLGPPLPQATLKITYASYYDERATPRLDIYLLTRG